MHFTDSHCPCPRQRKPEEPGRRHLLWAEGQSRESPVGKESDWGRVGPCKMSCQFLYLQNEGLGLVTLKALPAWKQPKFWVCGKGGIRLNLLVCSFVNSLPGPTGGCSCSTPAWCLGEFIPSREEDLVHCCCRWGPLFIHTHNEAAHQ